MELGQDHTVGDRCHIVRHYPEAGQRVNRRAKAPFDPSHTRGLRHTELIVLLGTVTAFAPLSIDMYLPALPVLGDEFGASPGHVQLSVATFFLGLAIGQGFYGPLSDRFGRTRPLYVGLTIFVLASIGCALSPSINFLIVMRFFQALGACSGQVIARAVVRVYLNPGSGAGVFIARAGDGRLAGARATARRTDIAVVPWRTIFWLSRRSGPGSAEFCCGCARPIEAITRIW
jgi:DHA1 family bicyclomycin/chloramphenicol resistance-like MFS transporter